MLYTCRPAGAIAWGGSAAIYLRIPIAVAIHLLNRRWRFQRLVGSLLRSLFGHLIAVRGEIDDLTIVDRSLIGLCKEETWFYSK